MNPLLFIATHFGTRKKSANVVTQVRFRVGKSGKRVLRKVLKKVLELKSTKKRHKKVLKTAQMFKFESAKKK